MKLSTYTSTVGTRGASAWKLSPCGTFSSSTMMVMMTAITPSLNASSLPFPKRPPRSRLRCSRLVSGPPRSLPPGAPLPGGKGCTRPLVRGERPDGIPDAALEQRADRRTELSSGHRLRGVGDGDRSVHNVARVPVAGHHAGVAGLALIREVIQVEHRSHRLGPRLTAPDIEIPVDVEVFVAGDAGDALLLAAHEARDLIERGTGIEYPEALLEALDRFQRRQDLLGALLHQLRVLAVDQGGGAETLPPRVRERHGVESKPLEGFRQRFIVDQSGHCHAGPHGDAETVRAGDTVRDARMQAVQAAIGVVACHVVAVDRYEQALQSRFRQRCDVTGEKPTVGDQTALHFRLGR